MGSIQMSCSPAVMQHLVPIRERCCDVPLGHQTRDTCGIICMCACTCSHGTSLDPSEPGDQLRGVQNGLVALVFFMEKPA